MALARNDGKARGIPALLILGIVLLAACTSSAPPAQQTLASTPSRARTAVLLAINDVYRIEGVEGGKQGGLARVRALRRELEREHPDLLVLHAGDLLYPSFASRMYNGEQMISVLDQLDGSDQRDPRLFITFGNHEFDKKKKKDSGLLAARIGQSQFTWLGGNVTLTETDDGRPFAAPGAVERSVLVNSGGIRIGLFGLTIPTADVQYAEFARPNETARALTAQLRKAGAEVVVALTHLTAAEDRGLLETLGDEGPDLIVGGHDHEKMAFEVGGRWVIKADADARTASVIKLRLDRGRVEVSYEHRLLGQGQPGSPEPDPEVQALVDQWQARHEKEFCASKQAAPNCLEEVYGRTLTVLEAEENKIRGRETSLGDWITDQMLKEFASCGAQIAFLNAGTLRLNQDLAAGSTFTRRQVEELFGFPTPLHLIRMNGKLLEQTAEQSVYGWPGSGTWLQIAGWAFVHDSANKAATGLVRLTPSGAVPVQPDEEILAVTGDYLVNPEIGDQDGYTFLPIAEVPGCPASGKDLKDVVIEALRAAEPKGIAPHAEGRICPGAEGPCLAGR
ncbi:MAG: 5'-nucleotidase C-terminal domain-containing protein [Acidobacteriota bacterium]